MQAVRGDQRVPQPSRENVGVPSTLESSLLHVGVLHSFAHNMSKNILHSFMNRLEWEESEVDCGCYHSQETLAEELASAVIEAALREASGTQPAEDFQNSRGVFQSSSSRRGRRAQKPAFPSTRETERDASLDADMDKNSSALQTSRGAWPCQPPLSQSGLPVVGSLDYPDAPPTTPLFPELVRSRDSFARKLKGGLAKEFLPSPPPPTPKDKQNGAAVTVAADECQAAVADPRVEFMEHLMRSLSIGYAEGGEIAWTDDLVRVVDGYQSENDDVGPQDRAKMAAYAQTLSGEIVDWVTNHYPLMLSAQNREQIEDDDDDDDVHLLAHRLAETIITSTLNEVKMASRVSM
ncbi:uncharacterized protein [Centroberyx affinis]|uniref:uncharacterized protein n=1 Tax=Centroberyx affinis TaxID=166261 RepID=UPI003A5C6A69